MYIHLCIYKKIYLGRRMYTKILSDSVYGFQRGMAPTSLATLALLKINKVDKNKSVSLIQRSENNWTYATRQST